MQIYRTKLYKINKSEEESINYVAFQTKNFIEAYPEDESIIYCVLSEDSNYFIDIATNIKIPMIRGFNIYTPGVNPFSSFGFKPKTIAYPKPLSIQELYYGACCLEEYNDKAKTFEALSYYITNKNSPKRQEYLLEKIRTNIFYDNHLEENIYSPIDNNKLMEETIRKHYHLVDDSYCSKFIPRKKYEVATGIVKGGTLPLTISCNSALEFGTEIYSKAQLFDYNQPTNSAYLLKRLVVSVNKDGTLSEVRTKRQIPIVYYLYDKVRKEARLMVNNRPATSEEQICFFVAADIPYNEASKNRIKEYKNTYSHLPRLIEEYCDKNIINGYARTLPINNPPKDKLPIVESSISKEQQASSIKITPGPIKEDIFSDITKSILNTRNSIKRAQISSKDKINYLAQLNALIEKYDKGISENKNQILQLYSEAAYRNDLISSLSELEIKVNLSESSTAKSLDFIETFLKYLELESLTSENYLLRIYNFLNIFNEKVLKDNYNLLEVIKAQTKIYQALFEALLPLDYQTKKRNVLMFDESTISQLSTTIDNKIDSMSNADYNSVAIQELTMLNKKKANKLDNDDKRLRDYILETTTIFNTLSTEKKRRK